MKNKLGHFLFCSILVIFFMPIYAVMMLVEEITGENTDVLI